MSADKRNIIICIGVTAVVYLVFKYIMPLAAPFIIAFLLAAGLNGQVRLLNRRLRLKRGIAAVVLMIFWGGMIANVIAHIRHDRRHLPQRRRGLLVGLAYVIGERGCLLLKLGRVRFGDGLLQALSTRHRLLQLVFHVQRRPYECAGENGEGCYYHEYADEDLATATFALDLANMLGAHTAAHAAGMRGAGSGIFWTGGCVGG